MSAKNAPKQELEKTEKSIHNLQNGIILTGKLFIDRFPNENKLFNKYF